MRTDKETYQKMEDPALFLSIKGLKGRQSVRTTFRLPDKTIRLLGLVASQLGIKQKSLFDQLAENGEALATLIRQSDDHSISLRNRRSKTFVLSRRSLEKIDSTAKKMDVPRDLLVDLSIQRLGPVMEMEKEKHLRRSNFLQELRAITRRMEKTSKRAAQELGESDQASVLLKRVHEVCSRALQDIDAMVERGRDLEKPEG